MAWRLGYTLLVLLRVSSALICGQVLVQRLQLAAAGEAERREGDLTATSRVWHWEHGELVMEDGLFYLTLSESFAVHCLSLLGTVHLFNPSSREQPL